MDHCDVSLGDYDGDAATFYNEEPRTARKPYKCNECMEDIAKGERHWAVVGKWDDEIRTYRFCSLCWEIIGEFSENGKTFGVVWDEFQDAWGSGASLQGCLNRLETAAAKEHMRRQWMKWQESERARAMRYRKS